ncbi:hypothetical protein EVAR_60806_1 [Eumeta japonica]|uniref:Uncharacterized protein n=1 Tax=Eumeta variegata TaxID=151549 RepID=A0A4C1YPE0_EUMVA|nr:hypothetical protein EVAR_60806_1 [Eumeta japonica]
MSAQRAGGTVIERSFSAQKKKRLIQPSAGLQAVKSVRHVPIGAGQAIRRPCILNVSTVKSSLFLRVYVSIRQKSKREPSVKYHHHDKCLDDIARHTLEVRTTLTALMEDELSLPAATSHGSNGNLLRGCHFAEEEAETTPVKMFLIRYPVEWYQIPTYPKPRHEGDKDIGGF